MNRTLIIGGAVVGAILGALLAIAYLCGCAATGPVRSETWEYVQPIGNA